MNSSTWMYSWKWSRCGDDEEISAPRSAARGLPALQFLPNERRPNGCAFQQKLRTNQDWSRRRAGAFHTPCVKTSRHDPIYGEKTQPTGPSKSPMASRIRGESPGATCTPVADGAPRLVPPEDTSINRGRREITEPGRRRCAASRTPNRSPQKP